MPTASTRSSATSPATWGSSSSSEPQSGRRPTGRSALRPRVDVHVQVLGILIGAEFGGHRCGSVLELHPPGDRLHRDEQSAQLLVRRPPEHRESTRLNY